MSGICCVSATREAVTHSCDRECVVDHITRVCWDALAELADTDLSSTGDSRSRPEYWVGHLQYLLGHLLVTLEETGSLTSW